MTPVSTVHVAAIPRPQPSRIVTPALVLQPDGIEQAITRGLRRTGSCSTPEGIEAAISRQFGDRRAGDDQCSTPEGIEAAIRRRRFGSGEDCLVLNARRHRGGDQPILMPVSSASVPVLNARRHRGGDQTSRGAGSRRRG